VAQDPDQAQSQRRTFQQARQQAEISVFAEMNAKDRCLYGHGPNTWDQIIAMIGNLKAPGFDERNWLQRKVDGMWEWLVFLVR
jgi:hypothetical protein